MFEKVNPSHPDKVADRIAGAIVDLAYTIEENPKIAVEVLLGHEHCYIIIESSIDFESIQDKVFSIVNRIVGQPTCSTLLIAKQDKHLMLNQMQGIRCGDNGIFKGVPTTQEQDELAKIARTLYKAYPYDGKYIINAGQLIICQSNAKGTEIQQHYDKKGYFTTVNPLGDWTGGIDVDAGATNRKLGSDMGDAVTGGGLHGKDLSKADVSVNIYAYLLAQVEKKEVELYCSIGSDVVIGRIVGKKSLSIPFTEIVKEARNYINNIGGFEKFAEWGLI